MNLLIKAMGESTTIDITFHGRYYTGKCKSFPAAISQGYSLEDVIRNLHEAFSLVIESTKCIRCVEHDQYGCMRKFMGHECHFEPVEETKDE